MTIKIVIIFKKNSRIITEKFQSDESFIKIQNEGKRLDLDQAAVKGAVCSRSALFALGYHYCIYFRMYSFFIDIYMKL